MHPAAFAYINHHHEHLTSDSLKQAAGVGVVVTIDDIEVKVLSAQ
jgi:hypothetical protein